MCNSSCIGGAARSPIGLDFTLVHNGMELGHITLDLKVCARPRRDHKDHIRTLSASNIPMPAPRHGPVVCERPFDQPVANELDTVNNMIKRVKGADEKALLLKMKQDLESERQGDANAEGEEDHRRHLLPASAMVVKPADIPFTPNGTASRTPQPNKAEGAPYTPLVKAGVPFSPLTIQTPGTDLTFMTPGAMLPSGNPNTVRRALCSMARALWPVVRKRPAPPTHAPCPTAGSS